MLIKNDIINHDAVTRPTRGVSHHVLCDTSTCCLASSQGETCGGVTWYTQTYPATTNSSFHETCSFCMKNVCNLPHVCLE